MSEKQNAQYHARDDMPLEGHVYIVDDNSEIRSLMCNLLNHYGLMVEAYPDAETFLMEAKVSTPGVILLDMSLPGMNGVSAFEYLKKSGKTTPVIYISGQSEHQEIINAMKLGANEFFLKPAPIDQLIIAIRNALLIDANQSAQSAHHERLDQQFNLLTKREKEIFTMMLEGMGNSEIAKRLHLMPDTVKKHRSKVMEKLEAQSLSVLVSLYRNFQPSSVLKDEFRED